MYNADHTVPQQGPTFSTLHNKMKSVLHMNALYRK